MPVYNITYYSATTVIYKHNHFWHRQQNWPRLLHRQAPWGEKARLRPRHSHRGLPHLKPGVVGKPFAQMKTTLVKFSSIFQILVSLDTISDWPWWLSWQHFYSQSLPTKKLQATVPIRLRCRHATPYKYYSQIFCCVDLQKNRCMRKELESSDLCLWLKSATMTFNLPYILRSDARSILSTQSV